LVVVWCRESCFVWLVEIGSGVCGWWIVGRVRLRQSEDDGAVLRKGGRLFGVVCSKKVQDREGKSRRRSLRREQRRINQLRAPTFEGAGHSNA
jgi:hypothetical protein